MSKQDPAARRQYEFDSRGVHYTMREIMQYEVEAIERDFTDRETGRVDAKKVMQKSLNTTIVSPPMGSNEFKRLSKSEWDSLVFAFSAINLWDIESVKNAAGLNKPGETGGDTENGATGQ